MTEANRQEALAQLGMLGADELSAAVAGVLAPPGEEFVQWLVRYLQRVTRTQYAFVGELWGADRDRVRTVAVCQRGRLVDNFEYDLRGTPCAEVVQQDICAHPAGVASVYPDDELLVQMGIDAYVGIALADAAGSPLGLMVVLDDAPMAAEQLALAVNTLDLLRERVNAELRHRATLWNLEVAVAGSTGDTMEVLLKGFANALHVRSAFVGRYLGEGRVSYPVVWRDGQRLEAGPFAIAKTLAARVRDNGELMLAVGAGQTGCAEPGLFGDSLDSYCAVAVRDQERQVVGLLGIIHDRELPPTLLGNPLFRLFRSRIAAELLRWDAEEQRLLMENSLADAQRREGLGTLAGGIAHDFNNLLVGILGNADLLLMDANEHSRDGLQTILDAAREASELCRQLLVYAGQGVHSSRPVDLGELIGKAQKLSSGLLPARCELNTSYEARVVVEADPVQLQQVVLNLIKNASESFAGFEAERPPTIRVAASVVDCKRSNFAKAVVGSQLPEGRYCLLEIADNGCGMSPETLGKIFDPFFSTKAQGHGLGLAAALGIVKRHCGALVVESSAGHGSHFRIYLPEHGGEVEVLPAGQVGASLVPQGRRVLVIDDEATVRKTICRMLTRVGWEAVSAESGREGLECYQTEWRSIDCVILDLSMPDMGGAQVLEALRSINPQARVLLATGFAEQRAMAALSELPDGILPKPFVASSVIDKVKEICR